MVNSGQKWALIAFCLVLFALALALRAYGANYGLLHGDERINDSARFLAGELVPTQHFYPPFFNYLNGVALIGLFGFGLMTEMWSGTGEFRDAYFSDPTPFYVAARYLTAAIGALCAPLFMLCARRVGLGLWPSFAVGVTIAVFPLGVFLAHIAKGDTALAVACVAVVWAFLMRLNASRILAWDIIIGFAVALAFGFKQSAVLVLLPLALAMIVVIARREGFGSALKSFGRSLLVLVLAWPIMNIGILLDIQGFLAFQNIQSVMSIKAEDGFGAGLQLTLTTFGDVVLGLNPIVLAMTAITPVWLISRSCRLDLKDALLGVWIANLVSTLAISLIVGTRQPEHLFLANQFIFLLLAAIATMDILRVFVRVPRFVMSVTAVCGVGLLAYGSGIVLQQASATPVSKDLMTYLSAEHPTAKIQSDIALKIPQTMDAQQMELDRVARLGEKYDVALPPLAPERLITENAEDALFWVNTPLVLMGLEDDATQDAEYEVQAHAWPVQPEDWQLDNRRAEGIDVFVVNGLDGKLTGSRSSNIRAFYQELTETCNVARAYDARKPMFLEFDLTVFDCSNA